MARAILRAPFDMGSGGGGAEATAPNEDAVGFAIEDAPVSASMEGPFTLELLHVTDQEAGTGPAGDIVNLSAVLNALRAEGAGDGTLVLSSGDAFIPGVFFDASAAVFGAGGIADIEIQNQLGFQAIALGNHEFDFGPQVLSQLITGEGLDADGNAVPLGAFDSPFLAGTSLEGQPFGGAQFPFLSVNLDFEDDPFLGPLEVAGGQAPQPRVVTSSVVIEAGGQPFGVVGAVTPTLGTISSPGAVGVNPAPFGSDPTPAELDALAAIIQAEVDALLAANPALDKVILLAHMQRLPIELALAERLSDVDVIVAGGSNTRLLDEDDRARAGDSVLGPYPIFVENAGGTSTAVVNTDGSYKYVGRLVIQFDETGAIIPESYDPAVSGAYATDAQGVADLGAEGLADPEIEGIVAAIEAQIIETESTVFGTSTVFLNAERSGTGAPDDPDGVRTQETNLGNLTADANLAVARAVDPTVAVSIKNGGGIRASIGEIVVPPGGTGEAERRPTPALTDSEGNLIKPEGGISQNDIQTSLAFNNALTLLTVTRAELVGLLEYGVSALPTAAGQFPQVAGVAFAFDPDLPAGARLTSAAIVDEAGAPIDVLVRDGALVGDPDAGVRVVTLDFLAEPRFDEAGDFIGGGDGYPFPFGEGVDRVDLADDTVTGEATFAPDGTEQDALAEYLLTLDGPFSQPDIGPSGDARIQNLAFREDTVLEDGPVGPFVVLNEVLGSTAGPDSEYVELFGAPGTPLDGYSVIVVSGRDNANQGLITLRFDFGPGDALGENGFFLIANDLAAQTYGVTPDATIGADSIVNASYTVALVETAAIPASGLPEGGAVLDSVGVSDGGEGDLFFFGAPVVGPDGPFLPAGVGRIADGVDTDAAEDWQILSFQNASPPNTPTPATGDGAGGGGDDATIDDAPTLISVVQGPGAASPIVGRTVVVEAIVTGDFQSGDGDPSRDLGGFFLMEEAEDFDGDPLTSEGVFVFEGSGDLLVDVAAGDRVRVLGEVIERFGKTTILAQEIRVEEAGAVEDVLSPAVPTALPGLEGRRAIESMLVTFTEPLTFVESFNYEQFLEGTLAAGGPIYQFTQTNAPDVGGNAAYQAEVADRTILIDDGTDGRRADLDPIPQPDGDLFAVDQGIRMGQDLEELTAIVDFGFNAWRLRLPEGAPFEPEIGTNPRPLTPPDVGSDFKVAAFNVLNYFTTLDAGGALTDIGLSPRGATNASEFERQSDKIVAAISALGADVVGVIEIENDFAGETFAIKELVARLNDAAGTMRWSWVDPGVEFVGSDAIAVGFLYDQTTVELVGEPAILDDPSFVAPLTGAAGGDNRAALVQTFREIESGGAFTAAVNHFKSKGSLTGAPEDANPGDGSGNNDATRTLAAERLAEFLATDPTGTGEQDVLILGDLNAYARERPIQALEAAGYTDLARAFEGEETYGYRFSGQIGTLDYAMASAGLLGQVTGAANWNINADELVIFDYGEVSTFGVPVARPQDQGLFDGASPARSSDHDAVLVGLDLQGDAPPPPIERELLVGTPGRDIIRGTAADEIIDGLGGSLDLVRGGGGSDVFVFTDIEGSRDRLRIQDYAPGEDFVAIGDQAIVRERVIGNNLLIEFAGPDRDGIVFAGITDLDRVTFVDDPFAVA